MSSSGFLNGLSAERFILCTEPLVCFVSPQRAPSSTTVGAGGRPPGGSKSPRVSGGGLRQGRAPSQGSSSRVRQTGSSAGSMWKFYTGDDSPGIKVGPVPVLVMSLLFIACVFLLHIWGKYTRS